MKRYNVTKNPTVGVCEECIKFKEITRFQGKNMCKECLSSDYECKLEDHLQMRSVAGSMVDTAPYRYRRAERSSTTHKLKGGWKMYVRSTRG